MPRWIATYTIEPNPPRVGAVDVRAASEHFPNVFDVTGDEWHVELGIRRGKDGAWTGTIGPTALDGTAYPDVVQNLGEAPELTSRMMRRVHPATAVRHLLEALQELRGAPAWATKRLAGDWQAFLAAPKPSGPALIAATAALYAAAVEAGDRRPVATTADKLGLSQSKVRDRIYRARQLGYLEPRDPGQGRPRGRLTVPATELLRKEGLIR
jgi:hypothetical protein